MASYLSDTTSVQMIDGKKYLCITTVEHIDTLGYDRCDFTLYWKYSNNALNNTYDIIALDNPNYSEPLVKNTSYYIAIDENYKYINVAVKATFSRGIDGMVSNGSVKSYNTLPEDSTSKSPKFFIAKYECLPAEKSGQFTFRLYLTTENTRWLDTPKQVTLSYGESENNLLNTTYMNFVQDGLYIDEVDSEVIEYNTVLDLSGHLNDNVNISNFYFNSTIYYSQDDIDRYGIYTEITPTYRLTMSSVELIAPNFDITNNIEDGFRLKIYKDTSYSLDTLTGYIVSLGSGDFITTNNISEVAELKVYLDNNEFEKDSYVIQMSYQPFPYITATVKAFYEIDGVYTNFSESVNKFIFKSNSNILTNNTTMYCDSQPFVHIDGTWFPIYLQSTIKPEYFGAKGDSISNDTIAFNAMFDYINKACTNVSDVEILLESGKKYNVETISLPTVNNLTINGSGATLVINNLHTVKSSSACIDYRGTEAHKLHNITIENIIIEPSIEVEGGNIFYFERVDTIHLKNVRCNSMNSNTNQVYIKQGIYISHCKDIKIHDCEIRGACKGAGIWLSNVSDAIVSNCIIRNTGRGGIYLLMTCDNVTISNNRLYDCVNNFSVSDGAIDLYGSGKCSNIRITDNYITNTSNNNPYVVTNGKFTPKGGGIRIISGEKVICENNTIDITNNNTLFGILVQNRGTYGTDVNGNPEPTKLFNNDIIIRNNIITYKKESTDGKYTDTSASYGIYVLGGWGDVYTPLTFVDDEGVTTYIAPSRDDTNTYYTIENYAVDTLISKDTYNTLPYVEIQKNGIDSEGNQYYDGTESDIYYKRTASNDAAYLDTNHNITIENNTVRTEKLYVEACTKVAAVVEDSICTYPKFDFLKYFKLNNSGVYESLIHNGAYSTAIINTIQYDSNNNPFYSLDDIYYLAPISDYDIYDYGSSETDYVPVYTQESNYTQVSLKPPSWSSTYTIYYCYDGSEYISLADLKKNGIIDGTPKFTENDPEYTEAYIGPYYRKTIVAIPVRYEDIDTNSIKNYYELVPLYVPEFSKDSMYTINDENSSGYSLLQYKPNNWNTQYSNYYRLTVNKFTQNAFRFRNSCYNINIFNNNVGSYEIPFPSNALVLVNGLKCSEFYRAFDIKENNIFSVGTSIIAQGLLGSRIEYNKIKAKSGITLKSCRNLEIDKGGIVCKGEVVTIANAENFLPKSLKTENIIVNNSISEISPDNSDFETNEDVNTDIDTEIDNTIENFI